eukprot:2120042-Prymnesium_polylepis.1
MGSFSCSLVRTTHPPCGTYFSGQQTAISFTRPTATRSTCLLVAPPSAATTARTGGGDPPSGVATATLAFRFRALTSLRHPASGCTCAPLPRPPIRPSRRSPPSAPRRDTNASPSSPASTCSTASRYAPPESAQLQPGDGSCASASASAASPQPRSSTRAQRTTSPPPQSRSLHTAAISTCRSPRTARCGREGAQPLPHRDSPPAPASAPSRCCSHSPPSPASPPPEASLPCRVPVHRPLQLAHSHTRVSRLQPLQPQLQVRWAQAATTHELPVRAHLQRVATERAPARALQRLRRPIALLRVVLRLQKLQRQPTHRALAQIAPRRAHTICRPIQQQIVRRARPVHSIHHDVVQRRRLVSAVQVRVRLQHHVILVVQHVHLVHARGRASDAFIIFTCRLRPGLATSASMSTTSNHTVTLLSFCSMLTALTPPSP